MAVVVATQVMVDKAVVVMVVVEMALLIPVAVVEASRPLHDSRGG